LVALGADTNQIGLLVPGETTRQPPGPADGSPVQAALTRTTDVDEPLGTINLPEGERRFYAQEVRAGRALVVVDGPRDSAEVRDVLLRHGGYDVHSRGAELARAQGVGLPGGTGPRPGDVSGPGEAVGR